MSVYCEVRTVSFNLLSPEFYIWILAHPVRKMWIIQEPKKVALWNKRHFEEKKRRVSSMFKILSTYICWKKYIKCNIWRVAVRPSYIQDARFLKVKYAYQGIRASKSNMTFSNSSNFWSILLKNYLHIRNFWNSEKTVFTWLE